jgi:hypothetical protein
MNGGQIQHWLLRRNKSAAFGIERTQLGRVSQASF